MRIGKHYFPEVEVSTADTALNITASTEELTTIIANNFNVSELPVTAILRVSPNGSGVDGISWESAFTTIQDALDSASTSPNDCTLILISPKATPYDIDMTGDPTWTGNYILQGSQRAWSAVHNNHASSTSIAKFTGRVWLRGIVFHLVDDNNGVIITGNGAHLTNCGFNGTASTGVSKALWLDGATALKGVELGDIHIIGHNAYTIGLLVDNVTHGTFNNIIISSCLKGIQQVGTDSYENEYYDLDIGECDATIAGEGVDGIAIDIDEGHEAKFHHIDFHKNTKNIDDEVQDHLWATIHGEFSIEAYPDNLTGGSVTTGGAGVFGNPATLVAAGAIDNPFRIVATIFEPATAEWYQIKFSHDGGATYYDSILFDLEKRVGGSAPSGTEYIFNAGTEITCIARDVSGGDICKVWLKIQKI